LKSDGQKSSGKVLYFEPGSGGHQIYYIELILRVLMTWDSAMTIVVCADSSVITGLKANDVLSRVISEQVEFIEHSQRETQELNQGALFRRGYYAWKLAQVRAMEVGADHLYFAYLDHAIVGALLNVFNSKGSHTISGLIFRPVQHYRRWSKVPGLKYRLDSIMKSILYAGGRMNRQVSTLFCLDDFYVDHLKETDGRAGKFSYLPDPAPPFLVDDAEPTQQTAARQAPGDRVSFILFGALQRRKGILQTLDAMAKLSDRALSNSSFHFKGRVAGDIKTEVYDRITALQSDRRGFDIQITDEFVSNEDLVNSVRNSDVVLAPYQRFVGSSGVLVWAIAFDKPVITQDFGYLGRFVSKERFGLALDTTSPDVLAAGIERMILEHTEFHLLATDQERLLDKLSPEAFGTALLSNWAKAM
jgi:glycosyltransferase involved in cell wall biosynthesis